MSKKIQFLFLCYKCIFWCWWARGVYGNVSRTLQTRKTTKNRTTFLRIHYNRDLYTNWTPAAPRHSGFVLTLPSRCTENDLPQKLLGPRSWASGFAASSSSTNFLRGFQSFWELWRGCSFSGDETCFCFDKLCFIIRRQLFSSRSEKYVSPTKMNVFRSVGKRTISTFLSI